MDASIKKTITAADKESQYDEKVKKLLGHKIILAHILVNTVDEFRGMNPKEVVNYIEGEPYISVVPVDPGVTNTNDNHTNAADKEPSMPSKDIKIPEQIIGFNTENSEINEGLIRFDIIFYIRMKNGLTQMIINIEAQKEEPGKYKILNRAIFYICRMISSQKGRDFINSEYNKLKRVYSIWICMNMDEDSLTHIHLCNDAILGTHNWKGDLDLLNIVMIGLTEKLPEKEEQYELHRLLSALLSPNLDALEKLEIMENEYSIPIEYDVRREVEEMCNLSQGIKEKAYADGEKKGYEAGEKSGSAKIIFKMYEAGLPVEQIANIIKEDIETVKNLLNEKDSF